MEISAEYPKKGIIKTSVLIDAVAFAFVYFTPSLSHLLALPLYFLEPMRIMVILALVHTKKENAYILALTLPLFSFFISGHPALPKMFLISFELALNIILFVFLSKEIKNIFIAALISIFAAKFAYYGLKFFMINFGALDGGLIATPLYIQAIMSLIASLYIYLIYRRRNSGSAA